MLWNYLTLLKELRLGDLIDIGLASTLLWVAIRALRTLRVRGVGFGLLLYGAVFLAADQLEFKLSEWILKGATAVIILIIVVVYQSEIRRLLNRFPASLLSRSRMDHAESSGLAEVLIHALEALAAGRRGALIVLQGIDPLDGIITAGTMLGGRLSLPLLLSVFDPNSPGHDGALVVNGDRVELFGSHLPLSDHDELLKGKGTRHAAALGLSEKTDALVLVVSEETGNISVARESRLRTIAAPEALRQEIEPFLEQYFEPVEKRDRLRNFTLWVGLEGLIATLVAACLWLVLVPGSVVQTSTYEVAVEVQNIPEGYALSSVTPGRVSVTLTGETRNLFKLNPDELVIRLDGTLTRFGRQTYPITSAHLLLPPKVEIVDLAPEQVKVSVRKLN